MIWMRLRCGCSSRRDSSEISRPDQAYAARCRIDQPDDAARHRRFAGAAFADDAERAALAQGQRHALARRHFAALCRRTSARDRPCRVRWFPAPPAPADSLRARARHQARHRREQVAGIFHRSAVRRMVSSVPVSTSRPWRITATRSAISATTPMSWVMNSTAVP